MNIVPYSSSPSSYDRGAEELKSQVKHDLVLEGLTWFGGRGGEVSQEHE